MTLWSRMLKGGQQSNVDLGPPSGRRQLICTPLAYVAQVVADAALIGGGQLVLRNTFEPSQILHTIQDKRVTHLALVEPLLVQLIDSDRFASTDNIVAHRDQPRRRRRRSQLACPAPRTPRPSD